MQEISYIRTAHESIVHNPSFSFPKATHGPFRTRRKCPTTTVMLPKHMLVVIEVAPEDMYRLGRLQILYLTSFQLYSIPSSVLYTYDKFTNETRIRTMSRSQRTSFSSSNKTRDTLQPPFLHAGMYFQSEFSASFAFAYTALCWLSLRSVRTLRWTVDRALSGRHVIVGRYYGLPTWDSFQYFLISIGDFFLEPEMSIRRVADIQPRLLRSACSCENVYIIRPSDWSCDCAQR